MRKEVYYSILAEAGVVANLLLLNDMYQLFIILILHLIACAFINIMLINFLPKRYKKNRKRIIGAFFALTFLGFSLFIIGYLALLVISLYLLRKQKSAEVPIKSFSLQELVTDRIPPKVNTYGEAPLYLLLAREEIPKSKLDVLSLIIAETKNAKLLGYVSKILSSSNDELRLSASSAYYKLEKEIQERINKLMDNFKMEASSFRKAYILFNIAQNYYDLVYYKLAEKELENITLQKAEEYIKEAIILREDPEFYILLGKIYIAKKEYSKAIEVLTKLSQKVYVNPIRYIPYMAEAYFGMGDLERTKILIKKHIRELSYTVNPYLVYIKDFWSVDYGIADK